MLMGLISCWLQLSCNLFIVILRSWIDFIVCPWLGVSMNLSPSLMCADAGHFAEQIALLEACDVDSFHIDIMDGEFVPNFALSWAEVALFRKLTDIPFDAHLMVQNLNTHIDFAAKCGINRVFIHVEHSNVHQLIVKVKSFGMQVGVALNPETSSDVLREFKDEISSVLLMRVHPGFAGQSGLDYVDDKINYIKTNFPKVDITVDGAVSKEVISKLQNRGVNGFVLGTSALFNKNRRYSDIIKQIRGILN